MRSKSLHVFIFANEFSVDLVASSKEQREVWASALVDLLDYFHERLRRSSIKERVMILGQSFLKPP